MVRHLDSKEKTFHFQLKVKFTFFNRIFDLPDGRARLLRVREGHSAPPLTIKCKLTTF